MPSAPTPPPGPPSDHAPEWVAYRQKWFRYADKREALLRQQLAYANAKIRTLEGRTSAAEDAAAKESMRLDRMSAKSRHDELMRLPKTDPRAIAYRARRATQARKDRARRKHRVETAAIIAETFAKLAEMSGAAD